MWAGDCKFENDKIYWCGEIGLIRPHHFLLTSSFIDVFITYPEVAKKSVQIAPYFKNLLSAPERTATQIYLRPL